MMNEPTITLLRTDKDRELLETAWSWRDTAPRWFVESLDSEKETFEDFISSDDLLFGVFNDGLTAIVRLVEQDAGIYQIHLMARRKTDWAVLAQAGLSLKEYLFDKKIAVLFFGWIPLRNKGIVKLYEYLGFIHNGEKRYRGQMHGKPILWKLMQCENN